MLSLKAYNTSQGQSTVSTCSLNSSPPANARSCYFVIYQKPSMSCLTANSSPGASCPCRRIDYPWTSPSLGMQTSPDGPWPSAPGSSCAVISIDPARASLGWSPFHNASPYRDDASTCRGTRWRCSPVTAESSSRRRGRRRRTLSYCPDCPIRTRQ